MNAKEVENARENLSAFKNRHAVGAGWYAAVGSGI
jgi:hypothetical protein